MFNMLHRSHLAIDAACSQFALQQLQCDFLGVAARGRVVVVADRLGDQFLFLGAPRVGRLRRGFADRQPLRGRPSPPPPPRSAPPVHPECVFEGVADHVGVALLAQPLGQRRRTGAPAPGCCSPPRGRSRRPASLRWCDCAREPSRAPSTTAGAPRRHPGRPVEAEPHRDCSHAQVHSGFVCVAAVSAGRGLGFGFGLGRRRLRRCGGLAGHGLGLRLRHLGFRLRQPRVSAAAPRVSAAALRVPAQAPGSCARIAWPGPRRSPPPRRPGSRCPAGSRCARRAAAAPTSVSAAEGSSSRAHTTSSSSRGAVAPRISPSPACTTSA